MVICRICKLRFKIVTNTHLKKVHGTSIKLYKRRFPGSSVGFLITPALLPKSDSRYQRWLLSLKKRQAWIKGKTKETDVRVKKISDTFKRKKINNFLQWQQKMKELGIIRSAYPSFHKSEELAFLVGMVLGDGNIGKFPRTERLLIALNSKYPDLIDYVASLMLKFFEGKIVRHKIRNSNCVKIWVYQKNISKRLQIPMGNRRWVTTGVPGWIWKSKKYIVGCLKGLFEAEGSLSIHLPTYTYNFQFSNKNQKLLDDVEKALRLLGFNPEVRSDKIRLRKKKEVFQFKELIKFRKYLITG